MLFLFCSSKTDDISRTEATDSLELGDEMAKIEEELAALARQRRELSAQLEAAKDSKKDHSSALDTIEDSLEQWEDLQSQAEDGKTVYAPSVRSKKRKQSSSPPEPRKRRKRIDSDDEDDIAPSRDAEEDDDSPAESTAIAIPLTEQEIEDKLSELKALKKDARRERGSIDETIRELRKKISDIESQEEELNSRQDEMCIAGRNEYSRSAIRHDFAAGIRELDQENAEEEGMSINSSPNF